MECKGDINTCRVEKLGCEGCYYNKKEGVKDHGEKNEHKSSKIR